MHNRLNRQPTLSKIQAADNKSAYVKEYVKQTEKFQETLQTITDTALADLKKFTESKDVKDEKHPEFDENKNLVGQKISNPAGIAVLIDDFKLVQGSIEKASKAKTQTDSNLLQSSTHAHSTSTPSSTQSTENQDSPLTEVIDITTENKADNKSEVKISTEDQEVQERTTINKAWDRITNYILFNHNHQEAQKERERIFQISKEQKNYLSRELEIIMIEYRDEKATDYRGKTGAELRKSSNKLRENEIKLHLVQDEINQFQSAENRKSHITKLQSSRENCLAELKAIEQELIKLREQKHDNAENIIKYNAKKSLDEKETQTRSDLLSSNQEMTDKISELIIAQKETENIYHDIQKDLEGFQNDSPAPTSLLSRQDSLLLERKELIAQRKNFQRLYDIHHELQLYLSKEEPATQAEKNIINHNINKLLSEFYKLLNHLDHTRADILEKNTQIKTYTEQGKTADKQAIKDYLTDIINEQQRNLNQASPSSKLPPALRRKSTMRNLAPTIDENQKAEKKVFTDAYEKGFTHKAQELKADNEKSAPKSKLLRAFSSKNLQTTSSSPSASQTILSSIPNLSPGEKQIAEIAINRGIRDATLGKQKNPEAAYADYTKRKMSFSDSSPIRRQSSSRVMDAFGTPTKQQTPGKGSTPSRRQTNLSIVPERIEQLAGKPKKQTFSTLESPDPPDDLPGAVPDTDNSANTGNVSSPASDKYRERARPANQNSVAEQRNSSDNKQVLRH